LLNDASHVYILLGRPQVSVKDMIPWVTDWLTGGGTTLGKPTHFEAKDGRF